MGGWEGTARRLSCHTLPLKLSPIRHINAIKGGLDAQGSVGWVPATAPTVAGLDDQDATEDEHQGQLDDEHNCAILGPEHGGRSSTITPRRVRTKAVLPNLL
eukprot:5224136-Prymnesium_polylepis.1